MVFFLYFLRKNINNLTLLEDQQDNQFVHFFKFLELNSWSKFPETCPLEMFVILDIKKSFFDNFKIFFGKSTLN